jgi:hypothetical protein
MKSYAIVFVSLAGAGLIWSAVSAQSQSQPRPGPGSGITTVAGSVQISNTPDVRVSNTPDVHISNTPAVSVRDLPPVTGAPLAFIRKSTPYLVIWSTGESERITIADAGQDGWVRVAARDESSRPRWVNLATARSIEEAR